MYSCFLEYLKISKYTRTMNASNKTLKTTSKMLQSKIYSITSIDLLQF